MSIYHMFNTKIAKKLGVTEAILLNHIKLLIDKNEANSENFFKDRYWTYGTAKSLAKSFTYLSNQQISRALKKLVDEGYLLKNNFNSNPFDRAYWYALSNKFMSEFGEI